MQTSNKKILACYGDKGGSLKKITVAERNLTLGADIRDAEVVIKE
ncbi:MAG: hypothetical protein ABIS45_11185 [Burkholderiales bacterium]